MTNQKPHTFNMRQIVIAVLAGSAFISASVFAADVSFGDKRFFKAAAQAGHYEIEGSKLAQTKAKNPEVKSFAKHLIDEHTKADAELKALAAKKGVELPTKPSLLQQASLKLLSTHDGANFDESYAENIGVDAHKSAIENFEEAADDADDPDLKQFAKKTLPALKEHLERAKALLAKVDK